MADFNKFIQLTDGLVEFEFMFNQLDEKTHSEYTLVVYIEEIKSIWNQIKAEYVSVLDSSDIVSPSDSKSAAKMSTGNESLIAVKQKYQTSLQVYVRLVGKINELMAKLKYSVDSNNPRNAHGFNAPPVKSNHSTRII